MNARCHKFEFPSEAEARRQLKKVRKSTRRNKKLANRLDVYQCHLHQGEVWHVGTNQFKTRKAVRYQRRRHANGLA